jgi:hypothetical protein
MGYDDDDDGYDDDDDGDNELWWLCDEEVKVQEI